MSRVPLVVFSFVTQVIHKNKTDRLTNKKNHQQIGYFLPSVLGQKKKTFI